MDFQSLPVEIIFMIMDLAKPDPDLKYISDLAKSCRVLRCYARYPFLWKRKIEIEFGTIQMYEGDKGEIEFIESFERTYKHYYRYFRKSYEIFRVYTAHATVPLSGTKHKTKTMALKFIKEKLSEFLKDSLLYELQPQTIKYIDDIYHDRFYVIPEYYVKPQGSIPSKYYYPHIIRELKGSKVGLASYYLYLTRQLEYHLRRCKSLRIFPHKKIHLEKKIERIGKIIFDFIKTHFVELCELYQTQKDGFIIYEIGRLSIYIRQVSEW